MNKIFEMNFIQLSEKKTAHTWFHLAPNYYIMFSVPSDYLLKPS